MLARICCFVTRSIVPAGGVALASEEQLRRTRMAMQGGSFMSSYLGTLISLLVRLYCWKLWKWKVFVFVILHGDVVGIYS
jgi:hypothetical protein